MRKFFTIVVFLFLFYSTFPLNNVRAQFFLFDSGVVGQDVKDFNAKTLSGKDVNFNTFRDGQNTIIFFWATWCPHCRVQLKVLNEQRQAIEAQGIKLAVVDMGEKADVVQRYVDKNKISFDIFLDPDSALAETYELIGVPTFIFISKDGKIKDVVYALPEDLMSIFEK